MNLRAEHVIGIIVIIAVTIVISVGIVYGTTNDAVETKSNNETITFLVEQGYSPLEAACAVKGCNLKSKDGIKNIEEASEEIKSISKNNFNDKENK